jgi:hypothetical protein
MTQVRPISSAAKATSDPWHSAEHPVFLDFPSHPELRGHLARPLPETPVDGSTHNNFCDDADQLISAELFIVSQP